MHRNFFIWADFLKNSNRMYLKKYCTVWKVMNFPIIQILCEINFISPKCQNLQLRQIWKLWSLILLNFKQILRAKILQNHNSEAPKLSKWPFLNLQKFISRKICIAEKVWNFHTVAFWWEKKIFFAPSRIRTHDLKFKKKFSYLLRWHFCPNYELMWLDVPLILVRKNFFGYTLTETSSY